MGLEVGTYISDLVVTNPVGAVDPKSQGDDHIRLIKSVLKNTFPNLNAAVNLTPTELNNLFTTGDVKLTLKTTADSGWVMMNDGSIGNASSGATSRANDDTEDLFTLIWDNISNDWAPLQDSSGSATPRGASAADDFAANRRLVLPKTLGRALAAAGSGSGLTARALGETLGEEEHALTAAENGPHTHTMQSAGAHSHTSPSDNLNGTGAARTSFNGGATTVPTSTDGAHTHVIDSAGSGDPHNNMQPSVFLNVMVKL